MTASLRIVSCVLACATALSCRDGTGPGDRVAEVTLQRVRWTQQSVSDYAFVARYTCFCALGGVDVRVQVRGGTVVSRTLVSSGEPLPDADAPSFPAIDGFFDRLRDALDQPAAEVRVQYDPIYHYPSSVYIDYSRSVADEEFGFLISEFTEQR